MECKNKGCLYLNQYFFDFISTFFQLSETLVCLLPVHLVNQGYAVELSVATMLNRSVVPCPKKKNTRLTTVFLFL